MAIRRKTLIITSLVILAVVVLVPPLINPLLEKTLDTYLREKIEIRQSSPLYAFSYETLEMNIYKRQITLYNFRMTPRDSVREAFRNGETEISSLKDLKISRVEIEGVVLANFLWNKHLDINKIQVDSVALDLYIDARSKTKPASEPKKGPTGVSLEGIRLPGMRELTLESFNLDNLTLHQILLPSRDTLIKFTSEGGTLEGVGMKKASETSFFEPELTNLTLILNSEKLDLRENLYSMGFEHLRYTFDSEDLFIRNLSFQPREDREVFRKTNRYSYEIYQGRLKELNILDFNLDDFLNEGHLYIDKVAADSLDLEIFRDKTKPFDESRQKLLIHQKMVAQNFPMRIGSIEVQNSYLKYSELSQEGKDPLVVDFSNLELRVANLTSMTEGLPDSEPLEIEIKARLDGSIPVDVRVELPYNSNTFTVKGRTEGTSNFTALNKTVLPAIGLQFTSGRLNGLYFDMRGTPWSLHGNLTLLYEDLKVELHKDDQQKRKTLSWAANTLLKKSNPKPNGHLVVGEIHTERVPYKGLGNYIWKGVQSGITNSLNPFGKHKVVKK